MQNKTVKNKQRSAADKRKLTRAGKEVELLYMFENSFSPFLFLFGKISAECHINPQFREIFSPDDMNQLALLLEHYRALTLIFGQHSNRTLSAKDLDHARDVMNRE